MVESRVKAFQGELLSVKTSICIIPDPVTQVYITAAIGKPEINGQVPVPENHIIVCFFLHLLFTIFDQPFSIFSQESFFGLLSGNTTFVAEIVGESNTQCGWQNAKKTLTEFIPEYFLQEFVTAVTGSKTVPMPNQEFMAVSYKGFRFIINGYGQFLFKIIFHPHVVVAHEKLNRNSGICKCSQFTQNAYVTFWYHGLILKPEIKQVTKDENFSCFVLNRFQEFDDILLPLQAG